MPQTATAAKKPELSAKTLVLIKGQKKTLNVKNIGKSVKVKWKTSKKTVTTVTKKGVITAKKKGSAKITATVLKKNLVCKVKVEIPSISQKKVVMTAGDGLSLLMNGTWQTVKWTSSNSKVASVSSSGYVRAVKPGTATITAKVLGKKFKCAVTVKAAFDSNTTKKLISRRDFVVNGPYDHETYQDIAYDHYDVYLSWGYHLGQ